jgi:hypothetical protein
MSTKTTNYVARSFTLDKESDDWLNEMSEKLSVPVSAYVRMMIKHSMKKEIMEIGASI